MNLAPGSISGWGRTGRWQNPALLGTLAAAFLAGHGQAGAAGLLIGTETTSGDAASRPLLSAVARVGELQAKVATPTLRPEAWQLPLAFEPAPAEAPAGADLMARGPGYSVFVGRAGALLSLRTADDTPPAVAENADKDTDNSPTSGSRRDPAALRQQRWARQLVHLQFEGAEPGAPARLENPLPGRIHRLLGSDPAAWQTGLATYARAHYSDVYPGIDVAFYGHGRELEYDLIVKPGASPEAARLRFAGVRSTTVDADGNLRLDTGHGVLVQRRPVAYQHGTRGRVPVEVAYITRDDGTVGFRVGAHDTTRPLVIDPVLSYATFVGGIGFDQVWDMAVDAAGAAYVVGETESATYSGISILSTNAFRTNYQGGVANLGGDVFVGKLNPGGTSFDWFTFLGGSDLDGGFAIALSPAGEPIVGGFTTSRNFPTTTNAYLRTVPGTVNRFTDRPPMCGFVTRLQPDGSGILASTYLGAEGEDQIVDLGVLTDGSVAVAGNTSSTNLPVTPNAAQNTNAGGLDAFVAVVSPDFSTLVSATYLGGSTRDSAEGLSVDTTNAVVYVTGITTSTNFPVAGALQSTNAGFADVFVTGVRAADGSLATSTYLGGTSNDYGYRLAIDAAGALWVTGETLSTNFPVLAAQQSTNAGSTDGFLLRLGAGARTLEYGTYVGGELADSCWDVAVDPLGGVHLAGETFSKTLVTLNTNWTQTTNAGLADVLVATLSPAGELRSWFLGSPGSELAFAVAGDAAGNTYVAGRSRSLTFPITSTNVAQPGFGGGTADGFVARLAEPPALAASADARGVMLSWPAPNAGYGLESAEAGTSASSTAWTAESATPRTVSGRHTVELPLTATNRVFRLRSVR